MPYELFVPGVDPGLRAWLKMREASRAAQLRGQGKGAFSVLKDSKYKYYLYWLETIYGLEAEEIEKIISLSDYELFSYKQFPEIPFESAEAQQNTLSQILEDVFNVDNNIATNSVLYIIRSRCTSYIMTLLQRKNFNINQKFGPLRRSILHLCCIHGDLDKVGLVVKQPHIKLDAVDSFGKTSLFFCIHPAEYLKNSFSIASLLLEAGARVDVQDKYGRSPLHYACILGIESIVILLLDYDAKLSIVDCNNKFPTDYCSDADILKIIYLYLSKPQRRPQLIKLQAREVSKSFISDCFRSLQPTCSICKRTEPQCALNKKKDYRMWLFSHGKLELERNSIKLAKRQLDQKTEDNAT